MAKQQKNKKKKLNRFLVFGIPIIVVLLAVGGFFAYKYLPIFNQGEEQTTEIKSDVLSSEIIDGNADEASSGFDDLIKNATDDKEKASIYLDRAWAYIYAEADNDKIKMAKEDALNAEKLDPSVSSALALRTIGEKLKDKELTDEYSKKYDERMKEADLPGGP